MKKYFLGSFAVALALAGSAFSIDVAAAKDPVYDWKIYDASGMPTSTFLEDKTEAQARSAYSNCNSTVTTCLRAYEQDQVTPLGIYVKKP